MGYFSGFSLRPLTLPVNPLVATPAQIPDGMGLILPTTEETGQVRGGATGFSVTDSFKPFRNNSVLLTGLWERYSRNFLVVREEARFTGMEKKSLSVSLRPVRYVSLTGSVQQSESLVGIPNLQKSYTYGVNGSTPGRVPVQVGYFKSVQISRGLSNVRFDLSQVSLQLPRWNRYSASATYSEIHWGGHMTRAVTETISTDFKRYGRIGIHDQIQVRNNHNYGVDWSHEFGKRGAYFQGGVERQTAGMIRPMIAPTVAFRMPLLRGQSLTTSYFRMRGSQFLRFEIGGPILRRREILTMDAHSAMIVPSTVGGQVYFDGDLDGQFRSKGDRPIPQMQVWLDGETSTSTDGAGFFRFEGVSPGTHQLRAVTTTLAANLVLTTEELQIAVMPYRTNRVDFRAIRTGRLRGVVMIEKMDEAGGAKEVPYPDARIMATGNHETFSEGDGAFVMGDLAPGSYQLRLDPASVPRGFVIQPATQTVTVKPGETSSEIRFLLVRPVVVKPAPAAQLSKRE